MPRRREVPKRTILPDPKFGNVTLAKFVNIIMMSGKKSVAERIVYGALEQVEEKSKADPIELFTKALDNVRPMVEVKSRRVGGATYQVPIEVPSRRAKSLALRWLAAASNARPEHTAAQRIAGELLDAAVGRGGAVKKKEDVERMAEANRAYAHYRW